MAGFAGDGLFVDATLVGGERARRLCHQLAGLDSAAGPGLGAGAGGVAVVAGVVGGRFGGRFGLAVVGGFVGLLGLVVLFVFFGLALSACVLHFFEQGGKCFVVHVFEPREGQRWLVAHSKEDHRVAGWGSFELEVEQPLVENADVLAGEVREVDRHGDPAVLAALAQAHAGAADLFKQAVHLAVGEDRLPAVEDGGLEDAQGTGEAVALGGRCEQFAAIGGHGQSRVMAALVDEAKEGEQAWPGAVRAGKAVAAAGGRLFQFFQ